MNCSGKHAAMLATCVANGWPLDSYLEVDHPLQQAIASTFARMTGEPVSDSPSTGAGRPCSRVADRVGPRVLEAGDRTDRRPRLWPSDPRSPGVRLWHQRDELTLLEAVPGAIGKAGAESCYVVALPDGRAVATKTDDGVRGRDRS